MTDVLNLLPPELRLTNTRHGLMLYPANDFYVGRCLETYGEYCPDEGDLFRQILKPNGIVLEAGANIGAHTVHLARLVGPAGQVYAFEPQRRIFQILCANLALGGIGHVVARQQGLGDVPSTMWVSPPDMGSVANFGGVSMRDSGREPVEIVTLDSLDLPHLDLIKVDVEGMEEAVIRGGTGTIRRLRPKLYIENDKQGSAPERSASLIRLVRELGYRLWWHQPPLYNPRNFRGFQENIFRGNVVSINMLCVRDDEPVETNLIEITADTDRPPM